MSNVLPHSQSYSHAQSEGLWKKNLQLSTNCPCIWGSEWFCTVMRAHIRLLTRHLSSIDLFIVIWWQDLLLRFSATVSWSAHTSSPESACPILEFRNLGCVTVSYLWWVPKKLWFHSFGVFLTLLTQEWWILFPACCFQNKSRTPPRI